MHFSDVFPFLLHLVKEFLIHLLSLVNVSTYTEKGQRFGEIVKTIKYNIILYMQLISISFCNLHSFYLQNFQNAIFFKKMMFFDVDISLEQFFCSNIY